MLQEKGAGAPRSHHPLLARFVRASLSISLTGEADTEVPTGTSYVLGDCGMLRPACCISGLVAMTHHIPF